MSSIRSLLHADHGVPSRRRAALLLRALVVVLLVGLPIADQAVRSPSPAHADPSTGQGLFTQTTTGAVTAGTVPDGVCQASVVALGGGGGSSSAGAGGTGGVGAAGAKISATFAVLPGQSYGGSVGGGGQNPTGGVGGGGTGGTIVQNHRGAGGGGRTVVNLAGNPVVVAGGGGGGGAAHQAAPAGVGGAAGLTVGAGAVAPGANGSNGSDNTGVTAGGGQGGQAAGGGTGGVNSASATLNGASGGGTSTAGVGGNGGPDPSFDSGGGGGAGYTGGGGGSATSIDTATGAGGGGGSSWVAATSPIVGTPAPTGIGGVAGATTASGTVSGANGRIDLDWIPCRYDLSLSKTVSAATVKAGDKVTWTVSVTNNGPDAMTKGDTVDLTDTLPAGPNGTPTPAYKVLSIATTGGSNANLSRGAVTCTGVSVGAAMPTATNCSRPFSAPSAPEAPTGGARGLDVGETLTITYEQIIANTAPCATITNTATVKDRPTTTGTTDITGNVVTDTVNTPVTIQCYDLSISKVASPKPQVIQGDPITWTVTVTNTGPADMAGPVATGTNPLVVTEAFPSTGVGAATLTSSTGPAGACTLSAGTVTCPGSLKSGEQQVLVFSQSVNAGTAAGTVIANTASVSDPKTGDANDTATDQTTVATVGLALSKTSSTASFTAAGDVISYTITATNTGTATLTSVGITDPNAVLGTCTPAIPVASLAGGATITCAATHTVVAADLTGAYPNTANVSATKPGGAAITASSAVSTPLAKLTVAKTATQSSFDAAGQVLNYSIVVTNAGTTAVTNATVADPNAVLGTCSPALPVASLAVGATISCAATHTVVAGDLSGSYVNTANATATRPGGGTVTASGSVTTPYAHLSLSKTAATSSFAAAGDVINYTITATNDGTAPLTNVSITDPNAVLGTCTPALPVASLAAGATITCAAAHTVVAGDLAGSYVNTATAAAATPNGGTLAPSASVTTPVAKVSITKTAAESSFRAAGDVLHYTITVTNPGTATLTNVSVTDPNAVLGTCTPALPTPTLAPGASISCAATHSIVAGDLAGSYANTATVNGTDPSGGAQTASATATTPVGKLAVSKTSSTASFKQVGDVLAYTITVTNTGTATLTGVTVTDPNAVLGTCTPALPVASLAPAESVSCTASHTVVAGDLAGSYVNTASAAATAPGGAAISGSGSVTTPVAKLSVVKAATEASFSAAGDVLHYSITVTNSGTATLSGAGVSDANAVLGTCTPALPVVSLAPGATITCTATHAIVAGDLAGSYTNTATASATAPGGSTVSASGVATTPVAKLVVAKTAAEASFVAAGDVLHYTITVTNSGTAPLTAVGVSDPNAVLGTCTPSLPVASLAAGSSITCGATHAVTAGDLAGSYANTATASATTPAGGTTSGSGTVTTPVSRLSVSKVAAEPSFSAAGDVLHYTITATNVGTATLTSVGVSDPNAALGTCTPTAPVATLAPGATISCAATHTVTAGDLAGSYSNTATVSGTGPGGVTPSASATAVTPVATVAISKSTPTASFSAAGDVLAYTITVTNTGTAALTGVGVSDAGATLGTCTPAVPATLAPGAVITCPASHTATAGDLAGSYVNTASTSATAPDGRTLTGSSSVTVPVGALAVSKSAGAAAYRQAGDTVTYTITVTNTGTSALSAVGVSDPTATVGSCTPAVPVAVLLPGATVVCPASHTVTAGDVGGGDLVNTASASATTPAGSTVSGSNSAIVPLAQLHVTKTAGASSFTAAGDVIPYTIVATNTGSSPLTGATVTDANASLGACTPAVPVATLAVGASITCAASHTAMAGDVGTPYTNTATASASGPGGLAVTASGSVTTPYSSLRISKTSSTPAVFSAGDTIGYSIVVTNAGSSAVGNVSIADAGATIGSCTPTLPVASLAAGATITCSATHTVVAGDVGAGYDNTATVTGTEPGGAVLSASDAVTVPYAHLTFAKTTPVAASQAAGEVISYRLVATNDGTAALTGVDIAETNATIASCTPALPVASLAPGESIVCTATHTVTLAEQNAGLVTNTATASGTAPGGTVLSPSSTAQTPATPDPRLIVTKVATPGTYDSVGDVIPYTITVTNSGNVTVFGADVADANATLGTCTPSLPVANLFPGGTIVCAATHAVTQAELDAGTVRNTATASGVAALGGPVSGTDSVDTALLRQPDLRLTKVADVSSVNAAGQVVHYTITATNTGNTTLRTVGVVDPGATISSCSPSLPVASLAPSASIVCNATHAVTQAELDSGSYTNTATAGATTPDSSTLTRIAAVTTTGVRAPELTTTKVATVATFAAVSDAVTFSIVATNSGNVTLTGVVVSDTNATIGSCSPSLPVAALAPGAAITCSATHAATQGDLDAGFVDNTASANGTAPGGASVLDASPAVIVPAVQSPQLTAAKSTSSLPFTAVGQTLTFTVSARNTGNVTISVVSLFDAAAALSSCTPALPIAVLAPGASVSCTATHTTTQDDLDAGHVDNAVRATGLDPHGAAVVADSPVVTVPAVQSPQLTTTKSTSTPTVSTVGAVITYSVTATNTGNVTISAATITDTNAALGTCAPSVPAARLVPSGSITCSATHVTSQADLDAGFVDNVATATGRDPNTAVITDDSPIVRVNTLRAPSLALAKSTPTVSFAAAGDVLGYTLVATNTGNVTIADVSLADPGATIGTCSPSLPVASLAPGASVTCAASHTATQADVDAGQHDNRATVTGTAPGSTPVSASSTLVSVPAPQLPSLTTTKSTVATSIRNVGQVITYSVGVVNSGNVTLSNVTVTDANATLAGCAPTLPVAALAPGSSISCTAHHTVTQADLDAGHYDNLASAAGTDPHGGAVAHDSSLVSLPAARVPELTVTKSSSSVSYAALGDTIGYSLAVQNSGNVSLSGVSVTDPGAVLTSCAPALPVPSLAPLATITCSASHTVTQADLDAGRYDNVAHAAGVDAVTGTVSADSAVVSVPAVQSAGLSVAKSSSTVSYAAVGDVISYSVVARNSGNVTLTGVSVSDPNAVLGACLPSLPVSSLAPGAEITCAATHAVTQADLDAGRYDNVAHGAGAGPSGAVSADSVVVSVPAAQSPRLTVAKSSSTVSYAAVGDVISYSVVATNSGNVTLTGVTVSDPNAVLGACSPSLPVSSLAPGAAITCAATHAVTQADLDARQYANTASAAGVGGGGTVSASSPTVTVPAVLSPAMTIAKSSPTADYAVVNDTLHYVLTVVNTGNVSLANVGLVDAGVVFGTCAPSFPIIVLAPGASVSCLASHLATQADLDAGHYDNVASTSASSPGGGSLARTSPTVSVPAAQSPSLSATKTAVSASYAAVGDPVSFTIHVVNDGNVTLQSATVTDPQATLGTCSPTIPVAALAPGATIDCTASRTATQADLDAGSITNVGHVAATTIGGAPVGRTTAPATVPAVQTAALDATKASATSGYAVPGDVIDYTIGGTNTGNVTITALSVLDANAVVGSCTPTLPTTLAPGASLACAARHTVTQADVDAGFYDNVATVQGTTPTGGTASADSPNVRVNAITGPSLQVTKTPAVATYAAVGDSITYSIVTRNNGNVTLSNVDVTDPAAAITSCAPSLPVPALAPGASITCSATHLATQADLDAGHYDNTAAAAGTDPGGSPVSASSTTSTVVATQSPALTTVKSSPTASYGEVGDVVAYAITATNTGNVTLSNVSITDAAATIALCSPVTPVASLAPGGHVTCLASHVATQGDLEAAHYDNVGSATASGSLGQSVTSDSAVVTVPADQRPHLAVAKVATGTTYGAIGASIGYTVTVTNDGNVALHGVTVADPGSSVGSCTPAEPATLLRNDVMTCTVTHTTTQGDLDAGHFDNVASATGVASGGGTASGSSPAVTVPAVRSPHLVITKSTSTAHYGYVGAPIDYTISVLNDGNVTIANLAITDANATLGTCTPALPASLPSGGSLTCTARHLSTQADLDNGWVDNAASVDGDDPTGAPTSATSGTVTVTAQLGPQLTVEKTSPTVDFDAVGDRVDYTVIVRNTGNVAVLDVRVTDPTATLGTCTPTIPVATLASGAVIVCTAAHTVTQADLDAGKAVNVARAAATSPDGANVTADSPSVTTPARQLPNLALVKHATLDDRNGNKVGNAGEDITYILTARNDGNVTLRDVVVADPMFPSLACDRQQPVDLAPGASYNCTGTHAIAAADVVNGSVLNTATASGASECSPGVVCDATVSDHAEAAVDAVPAPLPRTGVDTWRELRAALALVLVGGFLLVAPAGRRRDEDATPA